MDSMLDYLFERVGQLLKLPGALPILALVLLAIGVPRAQRSRRPRLYSAGVITGAVIVVCIWLLPLHLMIWLLPLVAGVLLAFGLPEAHTFRRPERFRIGIIMTAIGLLCFLLLPAVVPFFVENENFRMLLVLLALFVSVCVLTGGMGFIRTPDNTPQDDSWEFLR